MIKLKLACAATAAVFAGAIPVGAAQAAYVDPTIEVKVSDTTMLEGASFTATATSNVDCDWTLSFHGTAEQGDGTTFSADFTAPAVAKKTEFPLVGRCAFDDAAPASGPARVADPASVVPAATRNVTRTITITVLPKGQDDESGLLPDTGGPELSLLLIGGALIATGAAVTVVSRRRNAGA